MKHGHRDHRGGGRSSARETVARVAAGVIARKILATKNIRAGAFVDRIGKSAIPALPPAMSMDEALQLRSQNLLALPLPSHECETFLQLVEKNRNDKDSLGGGVQVWIDGLPVGLGEPVFDKLNALLAHALMSLPAAVGVEVGGGIALSLVPGSEVRDPLTQFGPASNRHGGVLGGMSSGTRLFAKIHFHAPTSIPQPIESARQSDGTKEIIVVGGRHDSFPLPRAVPMVEAMAMITIVDLLARAGALPSQIK